MPKLRSREQEIEDFVRIYLRGGLSRERVKKRLQGVYERKEDAELGLKIFDRIEKEKKTETVSRRKSKGFNVLKVLVAAALIASSAYLFYEYFQATSYSLNTCSSERLNLWISGPSAFRSQIIENLDLMGANDCTRFLIVMRGANRLEFSQGKTAKFEEDSNTLFMGSAEKEGWYYAAFMVRGSCMMKGFHKHGYSESLDKFCWEQAAAAVEGLYGKAEAARALRNKTLSSEWREFG